MWTTIKKANFSKKIKLTFHLLFLIYEKLTVFSLTDQGISFPQFKEGCNSKIIHGKKKENAMILKWSTLRRILINVQDFRVLIKTDKKMNSTKGKNGLEIWQKTKSILNMHKYTKNLGQISNYGWKKHMPLKITYNSIHIKR